MSWASISNGGKGRSCSRARAEQAAQRRAERWVERRRAERRELAKATTAKLARQRFLLRNGALPKEHQ
jgi:hypothetical protein